MGAINDKWSDGDPYEYFMGRWSSIMAPVFLNWLQLPSDLKWLDLGCGTGALSAAITHQCNPEHISCVDPSRGFIEKVKTRIPNGDFRVGSADAIPFQDHAFDVLASGLALNFFPDLSAAMNEITRVVKPGGNVAIYVWDYSGRMDFLRYFWDAAYAVDPNSREYDEGVRFPICNTEKLATTFQAAGLLNIETAMLDIETIFTDFDDFWNPFLGGQGPAPSFLLSLSEADQQDLKDRIRQRCTVESNGSIKMIARAIAVRAKRPE